ncbi:DUF6212 domain-containing protein [Azospirillum canadense]|uniref:DUF6212 domain-containing protein n=1 Tax=Azospirillum canadense TaxID=403962 RepID=UPI002226D59C|nr:DUF6212 domain-containing protein [Azospirillum canadense]MCW2238475.1 hypothetical protein [Azospirillum canadense]
MKLSAPASLFASLYDGTPKVIVLHRPAVPAGEGPNPDGVGGVLPLRTLHLVRHDGAYLLAAPGAGEGAGEAEPLRTLAIPPATVWCLWSRDEAAKADAERLLAWWEEAGGPGSAPFHVTGGPAEVQGALLERAFDAIRSLHRRNHDLQRNLSTLREEWGVGSRLPPETTELLDNLRLSPPRLLFATPRPVAAMPVPLRHGRSTGAPLEIVQRLPLWARGLVGIDLHLDRAPKGSGTFAITLHAIDSGRLVADWRVPFAAVRDGWLPLRLPAACERMDRILELRVGAIGVVTEAPRLSLAPAGLLDEYAVAPAARVGGQPGMLALRLWGGLPGLGYGPAEHMAEHPLPARMVWPLTEPVLAQVRKSIEHKATFPWFGFLRGGRILLHPLYGVTAAAHIPLEEVPGAIAVRGHAVIEDPRCRTPIACKLVVAAPNVSAEDAQREEGILASSGWVVLDAPRRTLGLAAALAAPWQGPMTLHLFTTIPDGSHGLYARTVFHDFEIEIDGSTAWASPAALPAASDLGPRDGDRDGDRTGSANGQ